VDFAVDVALVVAAGGLLVVRAIRWSRERRWITDGLDHEQPRSGPQP